MQFLFLVCALGTLCIHPLYVRVLFWCLSLNTYFLTYPKKKSCSQNPFLLELFFKNIVKRALSLFENYS